MFKLWSLFIPLIIILMLGGLSPVADAQNAPSPNWHSLLWEPTTDTLIWVSESGEEFRLPRPQLPHEDEDINTRPMFTVSRDGRYLAIIATTASQTYALGFYDMAAGYFTQVYESGTNEFIFVDNYLYGLNGNSDSTQVAVVFANPDIENPTWRIVIYDWATGQAIETLYNTDADVQAMIAAMPEVAQAPVTVPRVAVMAYDPTLGREVLHFQVLVWYSEGPDNSPAIAWTLGDAVDGQARLQDSPYDLLSAGIHPTTGEMVYAYFEPNLPAVPYEGFGFPYNVMERGFQLYENATRLLHTDQFALFRPQWGANDQLITYGSIVQQMDTASGFLTSDEQRWVYQVATDTHIALDNVVETHGFSGGVLAVTADNGLILVDAALHQTPIYQGSSPFEVIYATPTGSDFGLNTYTLPAP